jgi:type IV secretory pathway protease TraF
VPGVDQSDGGNGGGRAERRRVGCHIVVVVAASVVAAAARVPRLSHYRFDVSGSESITLCRRLQCRQNPRQRHVLVAKHYKKTNYDDLIDNSLRFGTRAA